MSTAAIVIDNFLDSGKWNTIQSGISGYVNAPTYSQNRTSLHSYINSWIQGRLVDLKLWKSSWENEVKIFSSLNVLPKDINVESSDPTNGGYHREEGGYIYYIHPDWNSAWGGNLKLKNCSVANIEPKPNRFVWVNPNVWHGIEAVNDTANTNRITVVAWPSGTLDYAGANLRINTL